MISEADILKASILIVDDQQADVSLLELALRGAGFISIASTTNPREVCALHRKNSYALILLDLRMPDMDGFQVMEDLKAIETEGYLSVLVFTAHPAHKLRALKAGAKDFVSKPLNLAEVLLRVHNLLEVRLLHRESSLQTQQAETRTEQVEAQGAQRIRASDLNYRRLFETAKDGIMILDAETGRIADVNPFLIDLLGFTHGEMMGKTVWELSPFKNIESNQVMLLREQKDQSVRFEQLLLETRAGRKISVEFVSNVNRAEDRDMIQCHVRDITERKHVEEIRDRLAAIVDSSDDAIISKTLDGRIAAWNRGAEIVFGYSAAEVVGKSMMFLLPPERVGEESDILARIKRGESVEHFETVRVRKDGARIDVSVTISPIRDSQGVVVGASKIARDITARKQAEEALREKERRLSESQRIAHIGSWSCDPADPEGRLVWSEEVYRIYGISPDSFVPTVESWLKLVVFEDRSALRKWIAACTAGEKPADMEFRVMMPDSTIRIFRRRGELQNQLGSGQARLVGTVQDVTEIRRAEQELRAQADLIDLSHDVIMVRELNGTIRSWNRGAEETYGYRREYAVGLIASALLRTIFPKPLIEIEAEFLQNGRWEGELTHTTRAGQAIVVESRWVLQRDSNGQPSHVMEANNDITERKQAEEASKRARVEAEDANSAKSNFLANMSHEIRTPMNAIMGMTYLALRADPAPEQRKYLSKISSAADSLLTIINDILDISKMEAGKMELECVPFSLDLVLSKLNDIVIHAAKQKNLAIVLSTEPGLRRNLIGDPLRLQQILINLVNNAIKFTHAGKVDLKVAVEDVTDKTMRLSFSVSDTGVGMNAEQIAKLFQPFNQADASHTRKFGGTGLGLAISKQLCDLMGGAITVESEPGKGTTFILKAEFGIATEPLRADQEQVDAKRRSILIADDNQTDRDTLFAMLHANGFSTRAVSSGEEALSALSRAANSADPFDLVLMDWRMPGITGLEAARQIKAHFDWPRMPAILMLTAFEPHELMRDTSGLDGFLLKPVKESLLLDAVSNIFVREVGVRFDRPEVGLPAGKSYGSASLAGRRVLLVEDIEINRDIGGELLADLGISVTMAVNGREGVDKALSGGFDLVLMDIQMPVMDGLAATRLIRADRRFAKLPIVAMTAHAMTGDYRRSLDAGMNDHLTKPIDPARLTEALLKWIPATPAHR
jgi:two-component system sensor histidine kinase/response regulator